MSSTAEHLPMIRSAPGIEPARRVPVPFTMALLFLTVALVSVSFWLVAVLLGQVICDSGACELATLSFRPLMTLYLTATASIWLLVMAWGTELFTKANRPERVMLLAGAMVGLGAASGALVVATIFTAVLGAICAAVVGVVWFLAFR